MLISRDASLTFTVLIFLSVVFFSLCFTDTALGQITIPEMMTHEKSVVPGQVIKGTIPILNKEDRVAKVKISQGDYLYYANGSNDFADAGTTARSNARWVSLYSTYLEIPPHATENFNYTIAVPNDSSLTGTYWSLIFIEPIEEKQQMSDENNEVGVQTIIRYGFQVITNIGQEGKYDIKILDKKISASADKKTFTVDVENIGTRRISPKVYLELFDKAGQGKGKFYANQAGCYPSCSVRYEIDLTQLPSGSYPAILVLDQGENAVFGAQYTLDIP